MSAVPPADGLAQVENPQSHETASIDVALGTEVESDWGKDAKFILIHPTVNGTDVGWFILDSGASGCTITSQAAGKAGGVASGSTRLQGETRTTVYRCEEFRMGPLTLTGLNMTGLNMSRSSNAFGRKVVGIVGRNAFASAIVELDGPGRAVRLHDPSTDGPTGAVPSHPIEMRRGLPHIRCTYAGAAEGLFVIDTGADATVHFFDSAVGRNKLTERPGVIVTGRKTQITLGSVGRVDTGTVAEFKIDGQQVGPVAAMFARPRDAPSKLLPDADGLIGMGLMRGFTVYFDEPKGRVFFLAATRPPMPRHNSSMQRTGLRAAPDVDRSAGDE